ncbi:hypothetical protein BKA66DRAFT_516404 [Pyrenochaeta sp. MPI-SDFR-AT-0127]|nr:hypothetical protein BKA66DRAFT_516404 [Pyrenochaeta sp. MPI-SDFR-AT-0127]
MSHPVRGPLSLLFGTSPSYGENLISSIAAQQNDIHEALAKLDKVQELVTARSLDLVVAYVYGDDVLPTVKENIKSDSLPIHLEATNADIALHKDTFDLTKFASKEAVSASCQRVSDASPVIGAAWWWHRWLETSYDELAQSLIAGHLLECSAYSTGSNFSGFDEYPVETFIDMPFPIAEISKDGSTIITKHKDTNGMVNQDTCRSHLLYELQAGRDRVLVSGVKGLPPPSTAKLAIFYRGGWEMEFSSNATGYATMEKRQLFEKQIRYFLQLRGVQEDQFQILDFQHFSGFHLSWDLRTVHPRSYLAYFSAIYAQDSIKTGIIILARDQSVKQDIDAGSPPYYTDLKPRDNYESTDPIDLSLLDTQRARLGDIVQARSGDKGANINTGFFVRKAEHFPWLSTYLTRSRLKTLMGKDWRADYHIERCEFAHLEAVHFVIYGPLGRGVSSCRLLDSLGKGFADYIRDRVVDVPKAFLADVAEIRKNRAAWQQNEGL